MQPMSRWDIMWGTPLKGDLFKLAEANRRAASSGQAKLRKGGYLDMRFKATRLALAKAKAEVGL